MHEGIGGKSALISIDDTPVFVKKVPLTDLEQLPQHFMSTANIFDLPLSYQYGVGSAGFQDSKAVILKLGLDKDLKKLKT